MRSILSQSWPGESLTLFQKEYTSGSNSTMVAWEITPAFSRERETDAPPAYVSYRWAPTRRFFLTTADRYSASALLLPGYRRGLRGSFISTPIGPIRLR